MPDHHRNRRLIDGYGTSWHSFANGQIDTTIAIVTTTKFPLVVTDDLFHSVKLTTTTNNPEAFPRPQKTKTQTHVQETRSTVVAVVGPCLAILCHLLVRLRARRYRIPLVVVTHICFPSFHQYLDYLASQEFPAAKTRGLTTKQVDRRWLTLSQSTLDFDSLSIPMS